MEIDNLKRLITERYLNVDEAIWVNKTAENQDVLNGDSDVLQFAMELLGFLKTNKEEIENKSVEDNLYLFAVIQHLERSIEMESDADELDEEYEGDEGDENEYDIDDFFDEIGGLTAEEQMKLQKEATVKYKGYDIQSIINNYHSFIIEKYPEILNGFDRRLYSNAKAAFWKKEHFFVLWLIPTEIYEKITDAQFKVEEALKTDIQDHSKKMFSSWYGDYKKWQKIN